MNRHIDPVCGMTVDPATAAGDELEQNTQAPEYTAQKECLIGHDVAE